MLQRIRRDISTNRTSLSLSDGFRQLMWNTIGRLMLMSEAHSGRLVSGLVTASAKRWRTLCFELLSPSCAGSLIGNWLTKIKWIGIGICGFIWFGKSHWCKFASLLSSGSRDWIRISGNFLDPLPRMDSSVDFGSSCYHRDWWWRDGELNTM